MSEERVLPLHGRTIVVTRARHQADALGDKLSARGAQVVYCPAIRIAPAANPAPFQAAVREIGSFDWLVLTSTNGVEALMGELVRQGKAPADLGALRIACVGPATAAAVRGQGLEPTAIPEEFISERIAELVTRESPGSPRVLLARAAGANPELPARLQASGAQIVEVESYRSVPDLENLADLDAMIGAASVDVITFTSPSTAEYLVNGLQHSLMGVRLAAIGPVTAARLRRLGLSVAIVAADHTTDGLVDSIIAYYAAEHG